MSNKLPPTNDPERSVRESEALFAREKAQQVTEALSEGKLPTTTQITTAIDEMRDSDVLHESTKVLSPLGKRVLADTEKVLETTKQVVEEKNAGDQLQNVMHYGNRIAKDLGDTQLPDVLPEHLKQKAEGKSATAGTLAKRAASKTANVVRLLVGSSEFRKLVNDIHAILQTAIAASVSQSQDVTPDIGDGKEKSVEEAMSETSTQLDEAQQAFQDSTLRELPEKLRGSLKQGSKVLKKSFMHENHRKILAQRFQSLAQEIVSHPEFQEAISDLIEIASHLSETSAEFTKAAQQQVTSTARDVEDRVKTPDVEIVEQNAKELLENFANGQSLDPLIHNLQELAIKIREDNEVKSYFHQLKTFVLRSVREPEFLKESDYIEHTSQLIEQGRNILLEHYAPLTQRISEEFARFNRGIQEDATTARLRRDLEDLVRDLFLDERGRPTIKLGLIKDFAKILPIIARKFEYIALPRIEGDDPDYEYIFENIVVHLKDIVPKHVHITFTADIDLDRENDRLQNILTIDITKIQADARNIAFFYKKKRGLMTLLDVGLVDFAIPEEGGGLNIHQKIRLNFPAKEKEPMTFEILESHTKISEFKLRLHDTQNHDILYKLLSPWAEGQARRHIEREVNERLKGSITYIQDSIATAQRKFEKEAKADEHAPNEEKLKTREEWASCAFEST